MNYDLNNYEEAQAKAKAKGKNIVLPATNELQIDIDSDEQYKIFKSRIGELNKCFHQVYGRITNFVISVREIPSPGSTDHRHIYVELVCNISEEERAFLQLFLGSDPIREYLAWCLCKIGDPHPTLFFEEK